LNARIIGLASWGQIGCDLFEDTVLGFHVLGCRILESMW